jgi:hypothetical protein
MEARAVPPHLKQLRAHLLRRGYPLSPAPHSDPDRAHLSVLRCAASPRLALDACPCLSAAGPPRAPGPPPRRRALLQGRRRRARGRRARARRPGRGPGRRLRRDRSGWCLCCPRERRGRPQGVRRNGRAGRRRLGRHA